MGSINGINPIIVDNIKVPTQKPAIIGTQRTKVDQDKKDREGKHSQGRSQPDQQGLETVVAKLNRLLEKNKIRLYFKIVEDNQLIMVQLISIDNQNIISEMAPEKVSELLTKFDTRGFTVDELR